MERITKEKVEYLNEISHRRNRVSIPHRIFSRRHSNQRFASTVNYHDINHTVKLNGNEDSLLQGFDDMTTFENKTICLISRYPFWTAFRRFLSNLHTMSSSPSTLPVERYISHLLLCVALPKPGGPSIIVPLPALCYPMVLSLPPNKDFPLVDLPFQTLFACLDVPTVVTMVIGMLALERKLIVVSTWPSLLLDVCELLKALLFPFELCAPYVPRLTEPFMSCLDFPGAIFVGIHDDRRTDGLAASVRGNLPEDSILVDLDTGCIHCCDNRFETIKTIWKGLPLGPKDVLVSELETLCRDACIVPGQEPLDSHIDITFNVTCGQSTIIEDLSDSPYVTSQMLDDRAIRDSFMRFFAAIMAGYEQFLVPPDLDFKTSGSEWFDTHGFLSAASPPYTSYLESFVCTQLFQSFIQRRTEASDIHCLLFDECLAEYHSSPIPYGRLGGDVETVAAIEDGSSQMLYSLLVDQCCAESYQLSRPVSSNREQSVSGASGLQSKSVSQLEASDVIRNQHGDLVMIPSKKDIPTNTRFVYTVDGNPCFPQKMNANYFHPFHPSSRLIEVSDSPPPLITRTEREVEESLRRQKMTSENSGIRNQSRCLWQLPKLMVSASLACVQSC
jgi:DENN (AEX-3) domain/dDENN domain